MNKLSDALIQSTINDNKSLSESVRESLIDRRAKEASMIKQARDMASKYPVMTIAGILIVIGLVGLGYAQYKYKIIKL